MVTFMKDRTSDERRSFEQLAQEQLGIYARELQEHYREERRLRQQVAEWDQRLQAIIQEMATLRDLLLSRLRQHFAHSEDQRQFLAAMDWLADRCAALGQKAPADLPTGVLGLEADIRALAEYARERQRTADELPQGACPSDFQIR